MDTVVFVVLLAACLSMLLEAVVGGNAIIRRRVKPCEDFYQYACDKWKRKVMAEDGVTPTQLKEGTVAEFRVVNYLRKKVRETDIQPVRWAKVHFKACNNETALNQIGIQPLAEIVNHASEFGWNLLEESSKYDWVAVHNSYCQLTGKGALFTVDVGPDENSESNVLIISPSEELFLRKISKLNPRDIRQYEKFLTDIWTEYNEQQEDHPTFSPLAVKGAIENVLRFRQTIIEERNLIQRAPNMTVMTLSSLEEHTRRIMGKKSLDWPRTLESIFKIVGNFKFNESTVVHIRQFNYVEIILRAIKSAPVEVLLNHINFHFVERFIQYTSADMNARFYEVLKRPLPERSITCISSNAMKKIVNFMYMMNFLTNHTIFTATEIAHNVREALIDEISRTNWIERETARIAMLKLGNMKEDFGYRLWYNYQINVIHYYYSKMPISKNYFRNILDFETLSYKHELRKLWRPVGEGFNKELTDMFNVNADAAYDYQTNTLAIPPALLQHIEFVWDSDLLYYPGNYHVNYGAFGTIVGYFLSRTLDSLGRQYDQNGNRRNWWGQETLNEYDKRLQCYLARFKQAIRRSELNVKFAQGNVNAYSDEIVAEYMGLAATRSAYRRVLAEFGELKIGRFRPRYDKLFFTAYAMRHCAVLLGTDTQLLHRLRVNTALSNTKAFANAFNCKPNDPMYSSDKCELLNESDF